MSRARYTQAAHKRKRRMMKKAKGMRGARNRLYRVAKENIARSMMYSYRDRKQKKREFRRLWIARINAAARMFGINYNRLISGLKKASVMLNRKILSDIAINDKDAFGKLVEIAKSSS